MLNIFDRHKKEWNYVFKLRNGSIFKFGRKKLFCKDSSLYLSKNVKFKKIGNINNFFYLY